MNSLENLTVSFVLPALNESEAVGYSINAIHKAGLERRKILYEVIVVDNNSTDDTALVAQKCGALVVEEKIRSYGAALITGIRAARNKIVITGDADGSYPFQDAIYLLDEYHQRPVDFLNTTRRVDCGTSMSLTSTVGNAFFYHLSRRTYGNNLPYTDILSGMWVFDRNKMLRLIERDTLPVAISTFSNHIKLLAYYGGLTCGEVPINYEKRKGGSSKIHVVRDGTRKLFYTIAYKRFFENLSNSVKEVRTASSH